ncbi:response regulator transcription factor [Lacisediminihabitans profunda]|uniref:Response regulator transcription factor n=1 Tax=Lacisediminihabitans profunda TaxID=2594790 RepID=A0A5C8UP71_9MICO|nr:response regulator transcription factor [Lacisediminihabitans profunda]
MRRRLRRQGARAPLVSADLIRVLVVDDQAIVRDGLVTVLSLLPDMEVAGEAADGEQAVRLAAELAPDVILMDLRMPVLDGTTATARILAQRPESAVLVLTTYADDESIAGALRAGARGYLSKDVGRAELAAAIRAVAHGQSTFSREVGDRVIGGLSGGEAGRLSPAALQERFAALTRREAEVLALVAEGLSNSEIAARLFVSIATVKTHINSIFAKLAVRDRAQAIAAARS